LEEFDFADMAKIREEIDAVVLSGPMSQPDDTPGETFTGLSSNRDISLISPPSQANGSPTIDGVVHDDLLPTSTTVESSADGIDRLRNTPPTGVFENASPQSHALKGEEIPSFFIDSQPSPVSSAPPIVVGHTERVTPLGLHEEPEEVIVYLAPYCRLSKPNFEGSVNKVTSTSAPTSTPPTLISPPPMPTFEQPCTLSSQPSNLTLAPVESPVFESVSFSFTDSVSSRNQPRYPPVFSIGGKAKAKVKARSKEARSARKRLEYQAAAETLGAMMFDESQSRTNRSKDRRWDERRRGDSDVDWGGESEENGGDILGIGGNADALAGMGGEMDLDPDLEMDINAMSGFVTSMSSTGSRFVTMDDIADEERMRREDEDEEDEESEGSRLDGELDAAVNEDEMATMAEPRDVRWAPDSDSVEEEEPSVDEDASPRASFQARLNRLREDARKRKISKSRVGFSVPEASVDDDDDFPKITAADEDEDFIASITVRPSSSHKTATIPLCRIYLTTSPSFFFIGIGG
jgi:hypothetical protein